MNLQVGKIYKLTNPMVKQRDFVHYLFIVSIDEQNNRITFNDLQNIGDNRVIYKHSLYKYILEEV